MLTGNLQKRSGKYYAVINLKVDGKRKPKWIPTDIPDSERNRRKAEQKLAELIAEYSEKQKIEQAEGADALKTKSSHRTLPLIPTMREKLLLQKQKQEVHQKVLGKAYCRDSLEYVCTDDFGVILRPNYVTEHLGWLIRKYGLKKIRFHDLRHAYVKRRQTIFNIFEEVFCII